MKVVLYCTGGEIFQLDVSNQLNSNTMQSLFPTMHMQAIDEALNQTARQVTYFSAVDMMKGHSTSDAMICSLHSASTTATLPTDLFAVDF